MMQQKPDWLPETISVNGEWEKVLDQLYQIFDRDFRQHGCSFEGRPVWWDQRKLDNPYEEAFWHLITKFDHQQKVRLLDPRRAERLPWCKPTIVNTREPELKVWRHEEAGGKIRVYLWIEDWDYVVILEERALRGGRNITFLITAFYVGGKATRVQLQKKYERQVKRL